MKRNDIVKMVFEKIERLYVVISPEEMNTSLNTVIICPLITNKRNLPTQILIRSNIKSGLSNDCYLALDQITFINKSDINLVIGEISDAEAERIALVLQEMFAL